MTRTTRKRNYALAALAAALVLLIGCEVDEETPTGRGKAVINLKLPTSSDAQASRAANTVLSGEQSRTLYPAGLEQWAYHLTFTDAGGTGHTYNPAAITPGEAQSFDLEAGTWTITAHGLKDGVELSLGSQTLVIEENTVTEFAITMEPVTGDAGGFGSFQFTITLPADAWGTMNLTKPDGSDLGLPALPITLATGAAIGTTTPAIMDINSGEYLVIVELEGDNQKRTGVYDAVHIYKGQTTTFTYEPDAVTNTTITDIDLTTYIPAPTAGKAVSPTTIMGGDQYSGLVVWKNSSGKEVYGTFSGSAVYTAEVTLTAKGNYTFAGVRADAFTHSDAASVSNAAGSGIVTIVFQRTAGLPGTGATVSIGFNYDITVTDVESGAAKDQLTLYQSGQPESALLAADDSYTDVRWYVGAVQVPSSKGEEVLLFEDDHQALIRAIDWPEGEQSLTFIGKAKVNSMTYSKRIPLWILSGNITYTASQVGNYLRFEFSEPISTFSRGNVLLISSTGSVTSEAAPLGGGALWYLPIEEVVQTGSITVAITRPGVDAAGQTLEVTALTRPEWTALSSFTDKDINGAVYGGGRFVWAGSYGKIAYSTDGLTWTSLLNPYGNTQLFEQRGVAYGGGTFVIVMTSGRMVYASGSNLDTWTEITQGDDAGSARFGTTDINGVTYGGQAGAEKFVAVGESGKMAYSLNGIDWEPVTGLAFSYGIKAVTYGGTADSEKFVAVGDAGWIAYSADGVAWTEAQGSVFGTTTVNGVTYGGTADSGKFLAVGAGGKMAYSADGVTWTAIPAGTENATSGTFGSGGTSLSINAAAYGDGKFVAAGEGGRMAYSEDCEVWTAIPASASTFAGSAVKALLYGAGKFLAVGGEGKAAYWASPAAP